MALKNKAGILVVCLAAAAAQAFPQSVSPEEEVVRSTYAALSFLCSVEPVTHAALAQMRQDYVSKKKLDRDTADATPLFELSDFHVGTVASIASVKWGEMFSVPDNGRVLRGSVVGDGYHWAGDGNQEVDWNAEWKEANVHWDTDLSFVHERIATIQSLTLAEAIALFAGHGDWGPPATYIRYATFTVNLTFQGKSTGPYKAAFLFGKGAEGKTAIVPLDAIGAGQLLGDVLHQSAYPSDVLKSKLREQPVMDRWIRANRLPMARCSAARADLCCADGRCALPEASVARDLAVQLPGQP